MFRLKSFFVNLIWMVFLMILQNLRDVLIKKRVSKRTSSGSDWMTNFGEFLPMEYVLPRVNRMEKTFRSFVYLFIYLFFFFFRFFFKNYLLSK